MMKLLPNEALLVEAMKDCQSVSEIAVQIGIKRESAHHLLKRLVNFGIIERSGSKRHYRHEVKDMPYEIVERRGRPQPEEGFKHDKLIEASIDIDLTKEQLSYLKKHRTLNRTVLARRLGLTKLQLNFALMKTRR